MPDTQSHPASFLTLPHWNYRPQLKGLSGIYLSIIIRRLAFGVLGLFIPIYIYQLTGDLKLVLLYYLFRALFFVITTLPIAKLVGKIGPDANMLLSTITAAIYFGLLILAEQLPAALWLAPFFSAIKTNLYWLPYHTAFSTVGKKENLNNDLRKASSIARLVKAFAPLLGGVIAAQFGFTPLFIISIILLLVSALPIFLDGYNRHEPLYNFSKLKRTMLKKENKPLFLSFVFQGTRMALDGIIWPLILFLAIPSLTKIGGLTTITLLVSLLVINVASKYITEFKWPVFGIGSLGRNIVWAIRGVVPFPLIIAITDPIYQLSSIFVNLPRQLLIYRKGRQGKLNFFTQREMCIHLGRFLGLAVVLTGILAGLSWPIAALVAVWAITLGSLFTYQYSQQSRGIISKFKAQFGRL
jgi:hypothetical protein